MKISSVSPVYMQPQAKVSSPKQKDNAKSDSFRQNSFSPALLLSANLNKVSFGNVSNEKDGLYCEYEEKVFPNEGSCGTKTRQLVKHPVDDFYDRDVSGACCDKSPKETSSETIFKDQVRQLCKSDKTGAENLAKELFEQLYAVDPQVAKSVFVNNLEILRENGEVDFLRSTKRSRRDQRIENHENGC